jgi:SAM-dependent methyltransferase
MEPKSRGWSDRYASAFTQASVVERYRFRPPFPPATFELLAELARGGAVLDAGCGPGDIARELAPRVARVDAVDVSARMIECGRHEPGGAAANLRWVLAPIEEAPLAPPYDLIVGGDSIHWFEWEVTFPRFVTALADRGVLAIVHRVWLDRPELQERLAPVYQRHSSNPDFQPLETIAELERRGLFQRGGERRFGPLPWRPTLEELLACLHSQSGFVLERQKDPAAFDAEVRAVVEELVEERDGHLELEASATVTWGRPAA